MKRRRDPVRGAWCIGRALPASPVNAFAEDGSLLVRRKRLRTVRGVIRVLQ